MTTLHGQEDMAPDILATAPRIPPPHKPLLPGHHQQTNTHPCTTNPADFVEPIQHTLVNSVTNTSALTVTSMHWNIYLTIVNNNQGSPDILHRSKKNQGPQHPSTGTMKAMKMGISREWHGLPPGYFPGTRTRTHTHTRWYPYTSTRGFSGQNESKNMIFGPEMKEI